MDNIEEKSTGNKGAGIYVMAFAIGAAIGLAAGFLYAPKAGKETRAMLKEKAQIAKVKVAEIVKKSKEVIDDKAQIAKKTVSEFIQESKHPVTATAKKGNGRDN